VNKKGFTLIELLAVIVIMGILALIIVPIVSNYITETRKDTYKAHETTMIEAAKSLTVECINGAETCTLPKEGQTEEVYLNELIDKSFAQRLQNPQGEGYCNSNLSYVRITNTGNSNYEYEACLYCGNYASDSSSCASINTENDRVPPTCGTIEGESSEWTNKSRVISVGCTDQGGSGCLRNRFSRTFTTSTNNSEIQITDRAGNIKECPVSVKVDKTPPSCELHVLDATNEVNGWVSGPVKVSFVSGSRKDSESGINTWGIGTSIENIDYNRQELIDLTNVNGVVTVIGYVKDNAGNEGTCSINLRTGIQRPAFDIYYGYQIFPLKDYHTDTGLNVTSNNVVTTTSTNPTMTFDNMSKYKNALKAVIVFDGAVGNPTDFKLTVDNGTVITARPMDSNKRLEFEIPKGTYNKYVFKFGKNTATYTVKRMEIQQTDNGIPTSKPITVDLYPDMSREKVKTNGYSFDNGSSFQTDYFKQFNSTTTNKAQTKNDIPMYSDKKQFNVEFLTESPKIIDTSDNSGGRAITYTPTTWTNGNVTITARGADVNAGIIAYGFSKSASLGYDDPSWHYITLTKNSVIKTHVVDTNGIYFYNLKSESGLTSNKSVAISNIDKIKPVCSISENSKVICTDSGSTDYGVSKINGYKYSTSNSMDGNYIAVSDTERLEVVHSITGSGTYYLFAKDNAGNISNVATYKYHKVSYSCNGGTPSATYDTYVREGTAILSNGNPVNGTPSCSKTGYTFVGWSTNNKATNKTNSLDMNTSDVTLYAVWSINSVGTPTISGTTDKIYGSSNTSLTCSESTKYSSDTKKVFQFGYSTTDGGTPSVWTTAKEEANDATSSTYTIGSTDYFGQRYWSCRVYAANSYLNTDTKTSNVTSDQLVTYRNATVTFDANGGSYSGTSPVYTRKGQTKVYTSALGTTESSIVVPTKTGHDFKGWYTAASNGSLVLTSSNAISSTNVAGYIASSKWNLTENKTLYASFSPHTYTITYETNGGTLPSTGTPKSYVYGTGTTIDGKATRNGYAFNGWSASSDLSSPSMSIKIDATTYGDKKYYAKWCQNCASVDHGSCTLDASSAGTCKYTTSCDTNYHYSSGQNTRTPVCVVDTYTLSYDLNGGSGTCNSITKNRNEAWGTLCSPTKTGYKFNGWYSGSTQITSTSTATSNITVKASWSALPYTLSYDLNGGSGTCSNITKNYGEKWGTLCSPTKSYKTFAGWFSGTTQVTANSTVTGNVSVKAKWNDTTCSVTYNANGGSGSMSNTNCTCGSTCTLSANSFTKANNDFGGWSTSANGAENYYNKESITITSNITLYAKWLPMGCVNSCAAMGKRCFFSGTNPNNYVKFNNELWRIIAHESDGSWQIIRGTSLNHTETFGSGNILFHASGSYGGSNVSSYLENTYYNSLTATAKGMIDKRYQKFGMYNSPPDSTDCKTQDKPNYSGNKSLYCYYWELDHAYTSKDTKYFTALTISDYLYGGPGEVKNNWLVDSYRYWAASSKSLDRSRQIGTDGCFKYMPHSNSYYVRPVTYLKNTVKLTGGAGTSTNPYTLGY